jgi:hypothetical protein
MSEEELAYYRLIEDHFAALRGTYFILSPKDFALMQRWWAQGIPLAAVLAAVGEVTERRRQSGEDVVSSLAYCRHAVMRHAKRFAAAHVATAGQAPAIDVALLLGGLAARIAAAGALWSSQPPLAAALERARAAVASLPTDLAPALIDEELAELESTTLEAIVLAMPPADRTRLDQDVDRALTELGTADEGARRALLVKAVRRHVGLPRLELDPDAA